MAINERHRTMGHAAQARAKTARTTSCAQNLRLVRRPGTPGGAHPRRPFPVCRFDPGVIPAPDERVAVGGPGAAAGVGLTEDFARGFEDQSKILHRTRGSLARAPDGGSRNRARPTEARSRAGPRQARSRVSPGGPKLPARHRAGPGARNLH